MQTKQFQSVTSEISVDGFGQNDVIWDVVDDADASLSDDNSWVDWWQSFIKQPSSTTPPSPTTPVADEPDCGPCS